jgi:colanic acid biosynthesis glycosyl transferase WcaI
MPKILVLSLLFPPDNVSTAHVIGGLAAGLLARGHDVRAVSSTPHYNPDQIAERGQPISGTLLRRSRFQGVPVVHLPMPKKSARVPLRLLAWGGFSAAGLLAPLLSGFVPDVVISPSPPLTLGVTASALDQIFRCPLIYNVQELYPDIAINLGALTDPRLIRAAYALERFVYGQAAALTVIGPRMAQRILEKGVPAEKVHVVPNYVDAADLTPAARSNPFSIRHGLTDKYVVSYAGNLGPAQGLEAMLDAAGRLSSDPRVIFLLVGEGTARSKLERIASERGLSNVLFLPQQPHSVVPEIYAATDLALVPQGVGTGGDALPSKVYRLLACERPVIACAGQDSDLAAFVRESGGGWVVAPGSGDAIASVVREALAAPELARERGRVGAAYVRTHLDREQVISRYEEIIARVTRLRSREGSGRSSKAQPSA